MKSMMRRLGAGVFSILLLLPELCAGNELDKVRAAFPWRKRTPTYKLSLLQ